MLALLELSDQIDKLLELAKDDRPSPASEAAQELVPVVDELRKMFDISSEAAASTYWACRKKHFVKDDVKKASTVAACSRLNLMRRQLDSGILATRLDQDSVLRSNIGSDSSLLGASGIRDATMVY